MLGEFVPGVEEIVGGNLVGLYLHGSIALQAFEPGQSDIDFLAATEHELDPGTIARLAAFHRRIGDLFDGSYLPRDVFRRFDSARTAHPHIESHVDGLVVDTHGGETIIYRYVLRERGIALVGPPARDLIDPVDAEQLRWGVRDVLAEWWRPMLDRPPERLLDAAYRAYAVVTMCRMRYTLAHGEVLSKPVAAAWAFEHVSSRWHDLIRRAAGRGECGYEETVALVRETLASANC
jgi:hypothetical protein